MAENNQNNQEEQEFLQRVENNLEEADKAFTSSLIHSATSMISNSRNLKNQISLPQVSNHCHRDNNRDHCPETSLGNTPKAKPPNSRRHKRIPKDAVFKYEIGETYRCILKSEYSPNVKVNRNASLQMRLAKIIDYSWSLKKKEPLYIAIFEKLTSTDEAVQYLSQERYLTEAEVNVESVDKYYREHCQSLSEQGYFKMSNKISVDQNQKYQNYDQQQLQQNHISNHLSMNYLFNDTNRNTENAIGYEKQECHQDDQIPMNSPKSVENDLSIPMICRGKRRKMMEITDEENQRKELKSPEKEVNILPELSPDTNKTPIHKQESKVEKFLNLLHVQNQSSTKNETLVNAAEQMSEEERENDGEIDYKALYMKVKRDNRVLIDTIAIILKNR